MAKQSMTALQVKAEPRTNQQDRGTDRKPWSVRLKVALHEQFGTRELQVRTLDLSPGGMAFQIDKFVHAGTRVSVTLPGAKPIALQGVVRSCVHQSGRMHRVGIQFNER